MMASAKTSPAMNQPPITRERLADAYAKARAHLLSQRDPGGFWLGRLAGSALSTATAAVCALTLADRHRFAALIVGGARWLLDHQMSDGGWGDTVKSFSNISTTMLCRAALTLGKGADAATAQRIDENLLRAEDYLKSAARGRGPRKPPPPISATFGQETPLSVPPPLF